jgi:diguanylate cyclase (GGDEF)-like protein
MNNNNNFLSWIVTASRQFLWRWWLLFIPLVLTVLVTFYLTSRLTKIYETRSTYVIRPRSELIINDEFVKALDTISRRIEINTTFAEVAQSDLIKDAAFMKLDLTEDQRQKLFASASVLAGTNILEIRAQGKNPELVRNFADAIGEETVNYVSNLYDVFELEPLDTAQVPQEPTSPNMMINLIIAIILGGGIGIGLVYLSRYLNQPKEDFNAINIIDPETGAYTKAYFQKRLRQEMSRLTKTNTSLSISLVKIKFDDWTMGQVNQNSWLDEMKSLKPFIDPYLREEDLLARYDLDTYSVLLPGLGEESALQLMKKLRLEISSLKFENNSQHRGIKVYGSIGLVSYISNKMVNSDDELIGFANFALKNADKSSTGGITRYVIESDGSINEIQEP